MLEKVKSQWLFLRELIQEPSAIGAALPSSKHLGRVMAEQIPLKTNGLIVELGAGTGSITAALTERFGPENLLIIERSADLYQYLKKRFPKSKVILGDASDLIDITANYSMPITAIASSLPLRSLSKDIVGSIEEAAYQTLEHNGFLIQFTYAPINTAKAVLPKFSYIKHKNVWFNVPPARVDVYQKCQ